MDSEAKLLLEAIFYISLIIGYPFIFRVASVLWSSIFNYLSPPQIIIIEVEIDGKIVEREINLDNDDELLEALLKARRANVL